MKILRNDAFRSFERAPEEPWWKGARIKDERAGELTPGGRCKLTLFEQAEEEGRAHPRLQVSMPPAVDPNPPARYLDPEAMPPQNPDAFRAWLKEVVAKNGSLLSEASLAEYPKPAGSERYFVNNILAQRKLALFAAVEARVRSVWGAWSATERNTATYAIRELTDEAFAGVHEQDDGDTGTYHSFGHDAPFVHYLEKLAMGLPAEGTKSFLLLPPEQQESVRRQREQIFAHLDHLMRHKYANIGIRETDIERSLGGLTIEREQRLIVTESAESKGSVTPVHEIIRIDPTSQHPHAGAWIHRDGNTLRLQDGTKVQVEESLLRRTRVSAENITFARAPHDPRLRSNVRFDWDGNGYTQPDAIGWIAWAGHCDIKAVMEQLGIVLKDAPMLVEYRSDSGAEQTWDRALLIEMIASSLELGSVYRIADGSGQIQRGVHEFGGARNDSRPDRIQFQGFGEGRHFRWPLSQRQDSFVVTAMETREGHVELGRMFMRNLPDLERIDFAPNPRFLKTVEGDYNLIDVSGSKLAAQAKTDRFDDSGYPVESRETVTIDLRSGAPKRQFLGTEIKDAARREVYRVYLEAEPPRIVAEVEVWRKEGAKYAPSPKPEDTVSMPLVRPLYATLSREMKRDEPSAFQALLRFALHKGQNICADTDMKAEVWNGVVTQIEMQKAGANREARVERWQAKIKARFGSATLDFLLRRNERGDPVDYCPAEGEDAADATPDFLWQDWPDVGTKGMEDGRWVINDTMLERRIVTKRWAPLEEGGFFVHDDHIKNVYELIYCGLAGYQWSIVHQNKRYGFRDEAAFQEAKSKLATLREALKFRGKGSGDAWPAALTPLAP